MSAREVFALTQCGSRPCIPPGIHDTSHCDVTRLRTPLVKLRQRIFRALAVAGVLAGIALGIHAVIEFRRDVADGLIRPLAWRAVHIGMSRAAAHGMLGPPTPAHSKANWEVWMRNGRAGGYRYLELHYFGRDPDQITCINEFLHRPSWSYSEVVYGESLPPPPHDDFGPLLTEEE